MKFIKRGEVIRLIHQVAPSVSKNTLMIYIDEGIIKHSDRKNGRGYKLFSLSYIKKVLKCVKVTIDWEKVAKIKLEGGDAT